MSYRKIKRIKLNKFNRYVISKKGIDYLIGLYVRLVYFFKDKDVFKNGER